MPDEIASKARALITSGLDGAPAELINRMPLLEIITVNSVGYDLVDVARATAWLGRAIVELRHYDNARTTASYAIRRKSTSSPAAVSCASVSS